VTTPHDVSDHVDREVTAGHSVRAPVDLDRLITKPRSEASGVRILVESAAGARVGRVGVERHVVVATGAACCQQGAHPPAKTTAGRLGPVAQVLEASHGPTVGQPSPTAPHARAIPTEPREAKDGHSALILKNQGHDEALAVRTGRDDAHGAVRSLPVAPVAGLRSDVQQRQHLGVGDQRPRRDGLEVIERLRVCLQLVHLPAHPCFVTAHGAPSGGPPRTAAAARDRASSGSSAVRIARGERPWVTRSGSGSAIDIAADDTLEPGHRGRSANHLWTATPAVDHGERSGKRSRFRHSRRPTTTAEDISPENRPCGGDAGSAAEGETPPFPGMPARKFRRSTGTVRRFGEVGARRPAEPGAAPKGGRHAEAPPGPAARVRHRKFQTVV